jgi:hypothetical protein
VFALSAMAAAVGAAAIWRMRTEKGQDLFIDLRKASHGINPELTFGPTINGWPYPNPIGNMHPFSVFPFQTNDGRWVYPSAVYPAQQFAWTNFLNCGANHRNVAAAIAKWNAEELEEAANAQGHTLCIARTAEEWASHPQGRYLAQEPVIAVRKIGESRPEPFGPAARPLSGIRVLSATHAVAGPVVGRTLAEQGAQVLQINRPDEFEHPWVYDDANVGFRSTFLDLNRPEANARGRKLAKEADVFVENYRGRKLAGFGLSPEQLAEQRPGIIVVSVRCYGWGGPWAERGGFDAGICCHRTRFARRNGWETVDATDRAYQRLRNGLSGSRRSNCGLDSPCEGRRQLPYHRESCAQRYVVSISWVDSSTGSIVCRESVPSSRIPVG